jgi:hypothetical protein
VDLSDSELIELLIVAGAVMALFCLPACIRVWRLWHAKDPAENDPIARP